MPNCKIRVPLQMLVSSDLRSDISLKTFVEVSNFRIHCCHSIRRTLGRNPGFRSWVMRYIYKFRASRGRRRRRRGQDIGGRSCTTGFGRRLQRLAVKAKIWKNETPTMNREGISERKSASTTRLAFGSRIASCRQLASSETRIASLWNTRTRVASSVLACPSAGYIRSRSQRLCVRHWKQIRGSPGSSSTCVSSALPSSAEYITLRTPKPR